jgi:hypothetical protein
LPLSFDEAVDEILKQLEESDGHIHLHTHEHRHEDMIKLKEQFQHRIQRLEE